MSRPLVVLLGLVGLAFLSGGDDATTLRRLGVAVSVVAVLLSGLVRGFVDWLVASDRRIIEAAAALEVVLMGVLVYALSYPRQKGDQ